MVQWAAHFKTVVGANGYAKAASLMEQFAQTWFPYRAVMSKLRPPAADEAAYARFMAANKLIDGLTTRLIAALKAKDKTEIKRLSDLADTERKARTEAAIDRCTTYCGA